MKYEKTQHSTEIKSVLDFRMGGAEAIMPITDALALIFKAFSRSVNQRKIGRLRTRSFWGDQTKVCEIWAASCPTILCSPVWQLHFKVQKAHSPGKLRTPLHQFNLILGVCWCIMGSRSRSQLWTSLKKFAKILLRYEHFCGPSRRDWMWTVGGVDWTDLRGRKQHQDVRDSRAKHL